MRRHNRSVTVLSLALSCAMMTSLARADERDERTVVNFSHAVKIPGMVLPPGTYIFTLLSPDTNRTDVAVIDGKTNKACGIISGISHFRMKPVSEAEFILRKGKNSNSPEILNAWFYPGVQDGLEFIYPKQR
jgi:hypothetical protein